VQACAEVMQHIIETVSSVWHIGKKLNHESCAKVDVTTSTTNIWEEVSVLLSPLSYFPYFTRKQFREPALPSTLTKPSAPVDVRRCVLCGLTLEEALVQCVHCNDIFCFEDQKSEFGVMCVKLNGILPRPEEQSVLAALESFQCPGCFDHNGPELYPVRVLLFSTMLIAY
jgi:hypothetical protein